MRLGGFEARALQIWVLNFESKELKFFAPKDPFHPQNPSATLPSSLNPHNFSSPFLFSSLLFSSCLSSPPTIWQHFNNPQSSSFSSTLPSLKLPTIVRRTNVGIRMMDQASGTYATALAEVAKKTNTLETTSADMEKVEKVFADPQIYKFFLNPTVGIEKKRQVVDDIATSCSLQSHVKNFLNILVEMRRIELVKDIVKEFDTFYNQYTDTQLAVVTLVVKLESTHLAQIAKHVQKMTRSKNVRIKTLIDPSLIAGFTIRYGSSGSKLIDMSVKKQLDEIATQLDFSDVLLAV